ncbi:MAG TPA: DUF1772 domain-containing protein [Pyrinomonadaceae bacterium]|jgi:uncharacterized membrane protein|nr:DUF1772 domain-containing protein [Pyrinomonadaceae bacterium]
MVFEIVATLSSGLFAGASVYINLVEHPARLECGTELAIREFGPSYRRAANVQASLAAIGLLMAVAAWLTNGSFWWFVGGVILAAVIPFTLIVIFPTNKKLLDPSLDKSSEVASTLLIRWGRLHSVRSLFSVVAFLIFVFLLSRAQ